VVNVTHKSVYLSWVPGFHGGMDQYFRIRYKSERSSRQMTTDIYPANVDAGFLHDLEPGTQYSIQIMAMNNIGESNYTYPAIIVRTASEYISDTSFLLDFITR
jgi:hypothetical protein